MQGLRSGEKERGLVLRRKVTDDDAPVDAHKTGGQSEGSSAPPPSRRQAQASWTS